MHRNVEVQIAAIAGRQRQLIDDVQLFRCGVSRATITRWVRSGKLVRVTRGVYLYGAQDVTKARLRTAAVMGYGPASAVTHVAGIDARGYTRFRSKIVDVTAPIQASRRIDGCRFHHQSAFGQCHHVNWDGDRLAHLAWNITDLGCDLTPHQIANVIHQGKFHERLRLEDLERVLEMRGAIPGCSVIREAIRIHVAGSSGTRSFGEDDWLEIGIEVWPNVPLVNTVVPFRSTTFELDFFWPIEGFAVEVDNFQHGRPKDKAHDELIDQACAEAGIPLLRVRGRDARRFPRASRQLLRGALEDAVRMPFPSSLI